MQSLVSGRRIGDKLFYYFSKFYFGDATSLVEIGNKREVSGYLWRYSKPNYITSKAVQSVLSSLSHGGIWQKLMKLMRWRYIFRSPLKFSNLASKGNLSQNLSFNVPFVDYWNR